MKNAANCVNQCELQDTLIIDVSNAHGGPGSLPGPRPVEGRFLPKRKFARACMYIRGRASRSVPRCHHPRPSQKQSAGPRRRRQRVVLMPREFFPSSPVAPSLFPPRALGGRSLRGRPPHGAQRSGSRAGVVAWWSLSHLARRSLLPSPPPLLDLNSDEMTP